MGCTCSRLDQQKHNRRKYPYRNTSNPRPNVEAFGGSQTRDEYSASPTGIAGFSDHGASQERARSLGEETVNTGETSSTYVRSPAAVALTARYQSAAVSAHPSLSPTPGSARAHHVNYGSPGSSVAPSPYAVGKGPVYINGNPDGVVTVDEADAPSPSPPSSDSDDDDVETTTSSDAGDTTEEGGAGSATQKTSTSGGVASPTRCEGTLSQPRDVAPVPEADAISPPRAAAAPGAAETSDATAVVLKTPVKTPSRGAAVGRGSVTFAASPVDATAAPTQSSPAPATPGASIAGDGVLSPNPLRGGSADRAVELAVAASAKKKARKVEPVLAPLEPSSAPAVALVNQTPRKVALGHAGTSDDEDAGEEEQEQQAVSSTHSDHGGVVAGDVDVSPPDSPMTSMAPSPTMADTVEESKVARAIIQDEEEAVKAAEKKQNPAPTLTEAELAKLLASHVGPAKAISTEEEQAWQNLCRRHTTGVTAVLRATREEYNRLMRQLEDAQQRGRKSVDTEQLGAIGRIRREFEEKTKKK